MSFPGLQGSVAAAAGGTPLDYTNLVAFWESETNVNDTAGEVDDWTDQSSNAIVLAQVGAEPGPELESNTQNGFDGLSFEETTEPDPIDRKLTSGAAVLDDLFFGSGAQTISFAARLDRATDFTFGLSNTICSKRFSFGLNQGWRLTILSDGTIDFRHFMTNQSKWQIQASGFYSPGDLVLGSITYDGGNSSGSGSFRLWNGATFVDTGTVTTATSSTKATDAAGDFVVGNIYDPARLNDNSPFQGPIFALWITDTAQNSIDDEYLQRWVP